MPRRKTPPQEFATQALDVPAEPPTPKNQVGLGWFAGQDLTKEEIAAKLRHFEEHGTFEAIQGDGSLDAPIVDPTEQRENAGDVPPPDTAAELLSGATEASTLIALARDGEGRAACWERLRKESRAAGMPRGQGPGTAYAWATAEVERLFPPIIAEPEPEPVEVVAEIAAEPIAIEIPEPIAEEKVSPIGDKSEPPPDLGVSGLGDLPAAWPTLPANAQLQTEIAWVSANRLRVRSGTGVDLSRALSPAPSYSALSWLETSILFPAKFADISVKATANQDDEREGIRREKLAIEEIRGLLAEMLEG